jgi:hypothetical protein
MAAPAIELTSEENGTPGTMNLGRLQLTRRTAVALGLVALGVILLLSGYIGISGETKVYRQFPYFLSGGIGGLFCLGLGGFLLYAADVERLRSEVATLQAHVSAMEAGLVSEFDRLHGVLSERAKHLT